MVSPSICGGFLRDKRSMVAFTWTITTLLTMFAFLTAVVLATQIHTHYHRMAKYYQSDDWYNNNVYNEQGDGEEEERGSHDAERDQQAYLLLSTLSAKSITFASVYTTMLATGLSLYGSTAIVGFTSLRGVYIAPCFSSDSNVMRVGIFGGAIVMFANLLVVCAVVLGEVRVGDYRDADGSDKEPYQVERIATVLAVTCMFLSALYTIFAILLFLCYAGGETLLSDRIDGHHETGGPSHPKPLVTVTTSDQRHMDMDSPGFITMENSSQGTST